MSRFTTIAATALVVISLGSVANAQSPEQVQAAADAYEVCVDDAAALAPGWYEQCVDANPSRSRVCRAWMPIAQDALITNNCLDKAAFDADEVEALTCTTQRLEYAETRVRACIDPINNASTVACAMRIPRACNACLNHTCAAGR